jgi:predicted SAM-dependent methyltransferase
MKTKPIIFSIFCLNFLVLQAKPHINTDLNALQQLANQGLTTKNDTIRLHFGCGQTHFKGYINIDFPPSHHTAQQTVKADIFGDITQLKFPANSIDEIRSHHLFEHFDRPTALALLSKWHEWLKIGGKIVIETPDLEKCVAIVNNNLYSYTQKQITLRHLFGSHEASWAYHYDGWYEEKFRHTLSQFGFEQINITKIVNPGWELVPNVMVTATKQKKLTPEKYASIASDLLRDSLVNNTEIRMHYIWNESYKKAISQMHLEDA